MLLVQNPSPPCLPEESRLPPLDRPAWPLERIRGFLASKRPATVLWALHRAANHREPMESGDIIDAVARLLDHDDEDVVERSLAVLLEFAGHPAARDVAAAIAGRLPALGEGTRGQCLALEALVELAPDDHVQAFADGLESGDADVELEALRGIAAGVSEGAVIHLLAFTARASTPVCAAVALAGLAQVRAEEFVERGAQVLIDHFLSDVGALSELALDLDETGLIPMDLYVRIEGSLFPVEDEIREMADRRSVLFPREDPAAARRAEEVVGPERADRILALADAGEHTELVRLIGDLALEAIEAASRENPAFGPLGRSLAGLARSILEWDELRELHEDDKKIAACILGTVLAKAVRGHDIEEELEEAEGDRTKLLDLCRVDEDWVDARTFELLARVLREEDAASLSGSADPSVGRIGSFLLSAMDPGRHAGKTLARIDWLLDLKRALFRGLLRVAGDVVLPALVDAVRGSPSESILLVMALERLGTERARVCLEHSLDALQEIRVLTILEAASATGSRAAAEKTIARIREAAFDVEQEIHLDSDLGDLRTEVEACLEILEIPGDADEILAEALRKAGERSSLAEDGDDVWYPPDEEDYDVEDEAEDDGSGPGWDDPDAPEPVAPIVRDAPKIGRNDPCPCGSGKKHKKCCGKSS